MNACELCATTVIIRDYEAILSLDIQETSAEGSIGTLCRLEKSKSTLEDMETGGPVSFQKADSIIYEAVLMTITTTSGTARKRRKSAAGFRSLLLSYPQWRG